jgi:hypothetical protein
MLVKVHQYGARPMTGLQYMEISPRRSQRRTNVQEHIGNYQGVDVRLTVDAPSNPPFREWTLDRPTLR